MHHIHRQSTCSQSNHDTWQAIRTGNIMRCDPKVRETVRKGDAYRYHLNTRTYEHCRQWQSGQGGETSCQINRKWCQNNNILNTRISKISKHQACKQGTLKSEIEGGKSNISTPMKNCNTETYWWKCKDLQYDQESKRRDMAHLVTDRPLFPEYVPIPIWDYRITNVQM